MSAVMTNLLLYVVAVLIWGSTWYAIEFQLGTVAIEVSIDYRFLVAAALLMKADVAATATMTATVNATSPCRAAL